MIDFRAQRALQFALLASLALHALALLYVPGFGAPLRAPVLPPLTAVLRNSPQTAEAPALAAEPSKESSKEQSRPATDRPRDAVAARSAPRADNPKPAATEPPRMTAPGADALPSTPSVEAHASAPPAPTAVASAPPSVSAPATPRAEPADPAALQAYLIQLSAYAVKYRKYPPLARERGWEGVTVVKLTVGANGRIRDLAVLSSSGYDVLDQHAAEIVRKAAPITEITPALRNREFSINVPVHFNIERKGG